MEPAERTTVGVGESVTIRALKGGVPANDVKWTYSGDAKVDSDTSAITFLRFGGTPGEGTLSLKVGTETTTLKYNVIEPTGLKTEVTRREIVGYQVNGNLAGMFIKITLLPDTVSFGGLKVKEFHDPFYDGTPNHIPSNVKPWNNEIEGEDHASLKDREFVTDDNDSERCSFKWMIDGKTGYKEFASTTQSGSRTRTDGYWIYINVDKFGHHVDNTED